MTIMRCLAHYERIAKCKVNMANRVNDVLGLSRTEQGVKPILPGPVSKHLIRQLSRFFAVNRFGSDRAKLAGYPARPDRGRISGRFLVYTFALRDYS